MKEFWNILERMEIANEYEQTPRQDFYPVTILSTQEWSKGITTTTTTTSISISRIIEIEIEIVVANIVIDINALLIDWRC